MQPEPERQDSPIAFNGSDLLVALEGHLFCTERPHVGQAENIQDEPALRGTAPFQRPLIVLAALSTGSYNYLQSQEVVYGPGAHVGFG